MPANHLDDSKVTFRKFVVLDDDTCCTHPKCSSVVPAGEPVYHARLREGDLYCSPECRGRDTRRLLQNRRRVEVAGQKPYEREMHLKHKYGLTAEEWDMLYDVQLGRCAICLIPLAETKPHVDHDHATGRVRGILCKLCNPGIGFFQDDPALLMRAAQYLSTEGAASAPASESGKEVMDNVDQLLSTVVPRCGE